MSGRGKKLNKIRKGLSLAVILGTGVTLTAPFIEYTLGVTVNDIPIESIESETLPDGLAEELEYIQETESTGEQESEGVTEDVESEELEVKPEVEEEIPVKEEEPTIEPKEESVNVQESKVEETNGTNKQARVMMASEDEPVYEVAKDTDFTFIKDTTKGYDVNGVHGYFRYTGKDDYVEIPTNIQGYTLKDYNRLFSEAPSTLKGVKSTNKNIVNMGEMFLGSYANSLDLRELDTSEVTSMYGMFDNSRTTEIDFSNFDTSKVTNMGYMFQNAKATTLDLRSFDTSRVTTMAYMFSGATATDINMSSFNTRNVSAMNMMFRSTQDESLEVGHFDTTNVLHMLSMFENAKTKTLDLSKFNTGVTISMQSMFQNSKVENLDLSSFDTKNTTSMSAMFSGASAKTIKVPSLNTSKVTTMEGMFQNVSVESLDLGSFKTDNVVTMSRMFQGTNIKTLNISSFNTKKVENMSSMFREYQGTYVDLTSLDTENVTNMSSMFRDSSLSTMDLSKFDTSSVTNMMSMFQGSKANKVDLRSFSTKKITDMSDMFNGSKATEILLSSFDTAIVTSMERMFMNTSMSKIDVGTFDMSSVNSTTDMFKGTKAVSGVARANSDVEKLNKSGSKPAGLTFVPIYTKATDEDFIGTVNGSFKYIGTKEYLEIPRTIRGVNVTNYKGMFENSKVKGVISTNKEVTDMSNMFKGNTSVELDVSTLDTSGVIDMSGMFANTKAKKLDLRNFDTSLVVNMGSMFSNAQVQEIDLGSFDLSKITNTDNMFSNTIATVGYSRTQGDMAKVNASKGKPENLKFTIWSIIATQTPTTWTNGAVDISIQSISDRVGLDYVERINEPGRNLLKNSSKEVGLTGAREFITYADLAPIFDTYGVEGVKYSLSLDLKSMDTSKSNRIQVYMQNGSSTKYGFVAQSVAVTEEYQRFKFEGLTPALSSPGDTSAMLAFYGIYGTGNYPVIKNVKIELGEKATPWTPAPEDSDSSNDKENTYRVFDNGTYIFRATNLAGETRTVAHTVKNIDKELPTLKVTKDTTGWTSQDVKLTVNAEDTLSGVKSITLPDGKVVTGKTVDYKATANGNYVFKVADNAGNVTTHTETVTNIDRSIPKVTASIDNTGWTKGNVNVSVTSEASASGLLDIKLVSGQGVTEPALSGNKKVYTLSNNGTYTFKATYGNGSTSEVSVNVDNIDREAPEITVKGNPVEYTEDDEITLEVTVEDKKSGLKSLTLPDGKTTTNKTTQLKVTENGEYVFKAEDNLGNVITHKVVVDRILVPYTFYLFDATGKPLSGAGFQLLRDGNVHGQAVSDTNGLVNFGKVPPTGRYTIKQTKAPDGYVVNPDEKDVEVGDTTEPEEFISYPREDTLPGTGTSEGAKLLTMVGLTVGSLGVIRYKKKK